MSECTHDCSTCGESCSERQEPQSLLKEHHPEAHIGKVFGIVSGKGGVGKSMVTSQLAVTMRRRGHQVGILDADVTGPSIPKAFGIHGQATGSEAGLYPMVSKTGIQVMSTNLLLPNETDPVIWRGPVISGVVQQFWTDVLWNCDYLFVDMPPGTGDVSLSVFQSIPLDGRSAPETAESDRGTPFQNEFEGAFAFRYRLYCRAGSGEPHRHGIQWLWRTWHVYRGAVEHPVRDSGDSRCQKKEG